MNYIDSLLALLVPFDCLGCQSEGSLLCPECAAGLSRPIERCYRCYRPSAGFRTCPHCRPSPLASVGSACAYDGLAKDVVWKLKTGRAQAAARDMARLMVVRLRPVKAPGLLITYAPTADSRVRQRGYDQAGLLAQAFGSVAGLPCRRLLDRSGSTRQVGTGRQQRRDQLSGAFCIRAPHVVKGRHILLIDDVVTTGASLEVAALALRTAGARRVDGLTFAQTI